MVNGIGGNYYNENSIMKIKYFNNKSKIRTLIIKDENITAYKEKNHYFYLV